MEGRVFDAQVVLSPKDTPIGEQLAKYVCVRITQMDNVDIGLFDRDWNNAIYFFVLNADEKIYMRYGGRESASPDTYNDLDSLELALKQGLVLHERYLKGDLKLPDRPKPFFPREIPLLVERTYARRQCVECHLIGDFQNIQRERDGTLDKVTHLYRSPDIKTIGIELDVPQGLLVKTVKGAVQTAGMKAGDRIVAWNGVPVYTFGDVQYRYDQVDRKAHEIKITVERDHAPVELTVALPERWWWTDLRFRQSSVDPRLGFDDRPLTAEEKQKAGLKPDSFASQVKYVSESARMMKTHDLRMGDIIVAVDGVEKDDIATDVELYVKLRTKAGQTLKLDVIRDGKRIQSTLTTQIMSFRK